ncbi:hypothetical protein DITRI_Ditri04bG0069300 [Diplodiscus trichospermus]
MNPQDQQPMLLSENCLKPYVKDDQFPFETDTQSPKGHYNLQDFHHLDHQIHANGSSSYPVFGVQTANCYDPFDAFPYGSCTNNVDFYECKPFDVGHGQVMDNFQISGGFLNHSQSNSMNDVMGSDFGYMPFDFHEMKAANFVVPDEVSSVTAENAYYKEVGINKNINRVLASTQKTFKGRKKSNVVKGQWMIEEDRLLIQLVERYGVRKWSHIAQMLPGRIGKQCRERWHNHLRPDIKKDTWSEEEDKVLIQAHIEIGNKWAEIAKKLPGRTENSIKNHWNATKRRQFSKRKCRSKYPRGSILQEYIKSLNLESSSSTRFQEKSCNDTTHEAIADKSSSKPSNYRTQALDFCHSTDRLVPQCDFNEVPDDFCLDEKLLQESCSIYSLLDDIPSAPVADSNDDHPQKSFETDMAPGMGAAVKKELDLVEMISKQAII